MDRTQGLLSIGSGHGRLRPGDEALINAHKWPDSDVVLSALSEAGYTVAKLERVGSRDGEAMSVKARDVREGSRIMWAGYRCTVTRVHRRPRERYAHRIWMEFDLDVPGLPPRAGVRYGPDESIETWKP